MGGPMAWALRLGLATAMTLVGFVLVGMPYPTTTGAWLAWLGVAALGGMIAGRPSGVWVVWLALAVLALAAVTTPGLGWLDDLRFYWWLSAALAVVLATLGFLAGTLLGGPRRPAEELRYRWAAMGRIGRRLVAFVGVAVPVALIGYAGYAFVVGGGAYVAQAPNSAPCDNPGQRFGWAFEPVNYDGSREPTALDPAAAAIHCTVVGPPAGDVVISSDGTPIAAWYVPAASGVGPGGPTVVLVHGGQARKTDLLRYAPPFHAEYNLLLLDLRNAGQSGGEMSSSGLYEQGDLRAMIDWLERTKAPTWIAVMGVSNGAATAIAEARSDPRIRALILDSMHASIEPQLGNVIEGEHHLPPWPATMAMVAGASFRLGGDVASVDPIRTIVEVGDRPILLTHGRLDSIDRPSESVERILSVAIGAGIDVEFHLCLGAEHGDVVDVCRDAWATWVTAFLAGARDR